MDFDHNKYFINALQRIIYPELKKLGFTKRGTLTFVRKTVDNVIQSINFQRSKWDTKNFYVNVGNLTLNKLQNKFYPEIGHRISQFENVKTDFNFQAPIIGDISLYDVLHLLEEKVIPYLDYCNSLERIHSFALFSRNNVEEFRILGGFAYPEGKSESLAFRHLSLKDYKKAREIYDGIEHRKFNPENKEWIYYRPTDFDPIIEQIDKGDFEEIENRIENNIKESLINLKFDKFKAYRNPEITLEELMSKLQRKSHLSERRSTFPFHYYKIFTKNDLEVTFNLLKDHLEQKYKLEIRENEIIAYVNDEFSFYLAINKADYVVEEGNQIESNYKGQKDISWIKFQKRRIEFWSDNDENMHYFNEHLYILEHWKNLDLEILYGDKLVFFDEL